MTYEKALDLMALHPSQTAMVAAHGYDLWATSVKQGNRVRKLYVRDERIMVIWEWMSMKQGT